MVQKKYVLMLALALKSACEASMVRKHPYLAEGEHGEAVAILDGIEISYGAAGSMQGQLPTVVRKTHEGERMEVDARGNIERAGDDREKAQAISMARVIELESELNDHKNRIRELEVALGKTKKACAENGFVKLRHDLLDADVEEIGTDATHGGKNEMSSESFRWAATQKHVNLYYGGNFDLLESDMKRNRNTQDRDYHMDSDITSSDLDKTLSKKPTPVPTPLPPDAPICHRSKACWTSYTQQGAVNVGAFAGSKENKCKNECASRAGCKKFSFTEGDSSLCWFFYSGECNSLRPITFDMDTCVMRFVPPTPKPPTPVPPTPKPPTPVPPTPKPPTPVPPTPTPTVSTYSWTQGQCRSGPPWPWGGLWDCSPGEISNAQCSALCDANQECGAYDLPTAGSSGSCCLFRFGNTGDGQLLRDCYVKQGATMYLEIANGKRCTPNKWLNDYDADPIVCMALIRSRSDCSHVYFNHATTGDGNCGCVTDATQDCADAANQINDGVVRIYALQSLQYCLQILTGTEAYNDGTLDVYVNTSNGEERVATGFHAKGSSVLNVCYGNPPLAVKVQNPTTDAWAGSIQYSYDARSTYHAMMCTEGCETQGSWTHSIVVDGNGDAGGQVPTQCLNGAACFLQASSLSYHLAPAGATTCDYGTSAAEADCDLVGKDLAASMGHTVTRPMQVVSWFRQCDTDPTIAGWGSVPKGCSVQSSGDWAPHFNSGSSSCNPFGAYQLVCTGAQAPPTPSLTVTPTPNPTPNGCCSWDSVCSDCGDDGTGWCHVSKANCDVCEGTWDNSGTPPTCPAIACRPCTATDPGCTHPGNADQAWCDAHCTSGANNDACPASYCLCAHAVYAITAANTSDCPSGTYRIESSHACEKAADILGFQYMGASTFYMHPRGCTTDLDNRVTHNFILPPAGQANTMEKLICARSSTCATHLCPENQQHKMGNEDLPQPDDNKCCEQKAKGADCMAQKLCEAEIGDLKNDTSFMCDCVFNHKGERNVTRCRKWLECLHQQRSLVRVWFKKLLEFSTDVPLASNGRSLVQVSNSSHGSEDTCYDPSKLDVFELDCNCAETLQQKCGSKVDDQECLISHACSNPKVCDSWKNGRCPSERAESLNEVRLRLESRAGSTLALEAKDTAEESLRSKC